MFFFRSLLNHSINEILSRPSKLERLYYKACSASGQNKIPYGEKFVQLIKYANEQQLSSIWAYGTDVFNLTDSIRKLDMDSKDAFLGLAVEFVTIYKEKGNRIPSGFHAYELEQRYESFFDVSLDNHQSNS